MDKKAKPLLVVRAKGPATEDGRIPLQDLLKIGEAVQAAVNRVAMVLAGEADSRRPGRKKKEIANCCPLEVVALNKKCFEIGFDLPTGTFPEMHPGMVAMEKWVKGWERIEGEDESLPEGYDLGVLHSTREMGRIINGGITELEVETNTPQQATRTYRMKKETYNKVVQRIQKPITNLRTVEGRLLMADFTQTSEKCRIHPPARPPISCTFDEAMEEDIYKYLRNYVRVTGETREDPVTGKIGSIKIRDIEPVTMEGEEFNTISAEEFWQDKSLEQLASEQGVRPINRLEEVFGKGADLWGNEKDFDKFLKTSHGIPVEEA